MTTRAEIIRSIGTDAEVAEKIGVKPRTVKSWRLGDRCPRVPEALKLVSLCALSVTLEDIYRMDKEAA